MKGLPSTQPREPEESSAWLVAAPLIVLGYTAAVLINGEGRFGEIGLPELILPAGLVLIGLGIRRLVYSTRAGKPAPARSIILAMGGVLLLGLFVFLQYWSEVLLHRESAHRAEIATSMLPRTASQGDYAIVLQLIGNGAKIDAKGDVPDAPDGCQMTALMSAAAAGHASTVELLLSRGADRTLTDCKGRTSIQLARNGLHDHPDRRDEYQKVIDYLTEPSPK